MKTYASPRMDQSQLMTEGEKGLGVVGVAVHFPPDD